MLRKAETGKSWAGWPLPSRVTAATMTLRSTSYHVTPYFYLKTIQDNQKTCKLPSTTWNQCAPTLWPRALGHGTCTALGFPHLSPGFQCPAPGTCGTSARLCSWLTWHFRKPEVKQTLREICVWGGGFLLFPTPAPYFLHSLPPTLGQHGLLTAVYLGRLRPHRERIACPPSPQSSYWAATTGPGVWLDSILAKQRNPHSLEELWLGSTGRIVRYKRTIKKKGITGHILSKMDSCATNDTIFNDFLTITQ